MSTHTHLEHQTFFKCAGTHTHLEHHKNQEGDVLSVSLIRLRTSTHINTNMHFDKGQGGLMF